MPISFPFSVSAHHGSPRKEINQPLNCSSATGHRQTFENLGDKHKTCDDESRKDLANRERGHDGNGHR